MLETWAAPAGNSSTFARRGGRDEGVSRHATLRAAQLLSEVEVAANSFSDVHGEDHPIANYLEILFEAIVRARDDWYSPLPPGGLDADAIAALRGFAYLLEYAVSTPQVINLSDFRLSLDEIADALNGPWGETLPAGYLTYLNSLTRKLRTGLEDSIATSPADLRSTVTQLIGELELLLDNGEVDPGQGSLRAALLKLRGAANSAFFGAVGGAVGTTTGKAIASTGEQIIKQITGG